MIATVIDQSGMVYTGEFDLEAFVKTPRAAIRVGNALRPKMENQAEVQFAPLIDFGWEDDAWVVPLRVIPRTADGPYVKAYLEARTKLREAYDRNQERQQKRLVLTGS